jgi:hypothetical protein
MGVQGKSPPFARKCVLSQWLTLIGAYKHKGLKAWFTLAILSAIFILQENVVERMTCKRRHLELFISEKRLYTFVCEFTHLHPSETQNRRQNS